MGSALNSHAAARISGGLLAATGLAFLASPQRISRLAAGGGAIPAPAIVRVLGARQLVQGVTSALWPRRNILLIGVLADTLHAASMVAAPAIWPEYRRCAAVSASIAGLSAATNGIILAARRR